MMILRLIFRLAFREPIQEYLATESFIPNSMNIKIFITQPFEIPYTKKKHESSFLSCPPRSVFSTVLGIIAQIYSFFLFEWNE